MGYNLLINGVYIGVITRLLLTFDPNFQRDIQVGQQQTGQEQEQKINDSPVSGYDDIFSRWALLNDPVVNGVIFNSSLVLHSYPVRRCFRYPKPTAKPLAEGISEHNKGL